MLVMNASRVDRMDIGLFRSLRAPVNNFGLAWQRWDSLGYIGAQRLTAWLKRGKALEAEYFVRHTLNPYSTYLEPYALVAEPL